MCFVLTESVAAAETLLFGLVAVSFVLVTKLALDQQA